MHIPDAARKTAGNALLSAGPRQSCYPGHIAPASLKQVERQEKVAVAVLVIRGTSPRPH